MAEEIYNGVTIERSWSLMAFAKENGLPKFREDVNKETGEVFNTSVEAANVNGGDSGNIRTAARNPKRSVKGFHYTYID